MDASKIKILGPEVGYVDLLNHETVAVMEAEAAKASDYHPLRPSSSGKCTRELAYELNEFTGRVFYQKEAKTAETARLLSLGSSIENHLIYQIKTHLAKVFKIKYQQQVLEFYQLTSDVDPSLNHMVEGSLDLVLWSDEYKCVVDVKSKKSKFHQAFKDDWEATSDKLAGMKTVSTISPDAYYVDDLPAFLEELNDPYFAANFLQLNGYACTDFLRKRGIDHGAIVQYAKNDSRIREIRFRPSQKLFDDVRAKFQIAIDSVATGKPETAPRDFVLGSVKCAFCPYKEQCRPGVNTLKEYFKTWPKKKWPTDVVDDELSMMFSAYELHQANSAQVEKIEQEILLIMEREQLEKVRLPNGHIYEIKALKSPRPHFELRRGKL